MENPSFTELEKWADSDPHHQVKITRTLDDVWLVTLTHAPGIDRAPVYGCHADLQVAIENALHEVQVAA